MGKSHKTEKGKKRNKAPKKPLTAAQKAKLKEEPLIKNLYDPKYCKQLKNFFDFPELFKRSFPTFEGFANIIGVTSRTLLNWAKEYPEFAEAYEAAKDRQKEIVCEGALTGKYNPQFAKFFAMNENGMKEKIETDQKIVYKVDLPPECEDEGD